MGINIIKPGEWVEDSEDLNCNEKDLIEFDRGTYNHWAMYIGKWKNQNKMVVHFNPSADNEKVGLGWKPGKVTVGKLKDVVGSSKVRVNNLIDESPRNWKDIEEIIDKLEDKEGCRYSLVTNNCENFVTYLRFEVTSAFRSQMAGGLLSKIFPTWYIGTYDNGQMQTKQWDEYVKAAKEGRNPRNVMPIWAYM